MWMPSSLIPRVHKWSERALERLPDSLGRGRIESFSFDVFPEGEDCHGATIILVSVGAGFPAGRGCARRFQAAVDEAFAPLTKVADFCRENGLEVERVRVGYFEENGDSE